MWASKTGALATNSAMEKLPMTAQILVAISRQRASQLADCWSKAPASTARAWVSPRPGGACWAFGRKFAVSDIALKLAGSTSWGLTTNGCERMTVSLLAKPLVIVLMVLTFRLTTSKPPSIDTC